MVIKSLDDSETTKKLAQKSADRHLDQVFATSFTRKSFLKFVLPSVVTMLVISLYSIVDGIFVSNVVGSNALAAVNIVYPLLNIVYALGIMLAVGGTAIVAIRLGEREKDRADKTFSLVSMVGLFFGLILAVVFYLNLEALVDFLGAIPETKEYCLAYIGSLCFFMPVMILKILFEHFIRADGRADFSLYISIGGGIVNIALDYLFIVVFGWGVVGAAVATGLGFFFSLFASVIYFISNKSVLKLKKAKIKVGVISNVLVNGSSQMVNELSLGIITFAFNFMALKYAGADGVAALTIIMYAEFLLISVFLGFANGVAPILSYNFGAKKQKNLKRVIQYSVEIVLISSVLVFLFAELAAPLICKAFVAADNNVYSLAVPGLRLFAIAYCFIGFNLLVSAIFAAFNNGKIATIIAASRSLIFVFVALFLLTPILELNGVWLAIPFSDAITFLISCLLFRHYKKVYHY